jgi:hypothetical protein
MEILKAYLQLCVLILSLCFASFFFKIILIPTERTVGPDGIRSGVELEAR